MTEFLPKLLNMSITGGIIILAVLPVRLLLRRAPKVLSYALWAVVLFRLLCPVSVPSPASVLNLLGAPAESGKMAYIPEDIAYRSEPAVELPGPGVSQAVNAILPRPQVGDSVNPLQVQSAVLCVIWAAGAAALLLYSLVKLLRLRRKLVGSLQLQRGVYLADHITSPFVIGLFRPRIYLPSSLSQEEQEYIFFHEEHHIRRGDHIVRILAFAALCVHWFNPLVWAAFILSGNDMEMSCDEAVMKRMGGDVRESYSRSLLSLATGRRIIAGTPLAFGEGDTKGRIKNVLNYKKPAFWLVIAGVAVCAAAAVCLATNPVVKAVDPPVFGARYRVTGDASLIYETEYTAGVEDYPSIAPQNLQSVSIDEDGVLTLEYRGAGFLKAAALEEAKLTKENFDRFFDYPDAVFGMRKHSDEAYLCVQSRENGEALIYYVIGTPQDEVFLVCGTWNPEGLSDPGSDYIRMLWEAPLVRQEGEPVGKRSQCLARIVEITGGTLLVEPVEGSWERSSGDRFTLNASLLPDSPQPRVGDMVCIVHDGEILEIYPCLFSKVYSVEVVSDELAALREKYPEYFQCATFKGLEVYAWQFAEEHYAFGLMSGTNRNKTQEELMALKGATAEEMGQILAWYGIDDSQIFVIPYGHPASSYVVPTETWESREYVDRLRAMLGLSPLPEVSDTGGAEGPTETAAEEPAPSTLIWMPKSTEGDSSTRVYQILK